MQLLRGDADLGAEPELLAVGETRARVHDDRRGVDFLREAARGVEIVREDRFRVAGAEPVDVRDRGVEVGRNRDRHLQVEILGPEVFVGRGADVRGPALRFGVADELDALGVQHVGNSRHERVGDVGVHDERLGACCTRSCAASSRSPQS